MVIEHISHLAERLALALERIALAIERRSTTAVSAIEPEALSKEDAARFLGVDEGTVEHLIRTRKLAYVQHGSQRGRVIPVAALRAFLEEYRQATGEELSDRRRARGARP
jgi:excisionase family DNA binding protein